MLTLWIGYLLLVSACVAAVAIAVERVLVIWTMPRRFVWIAALLCTAVLPAGMLRRVAPAAALSRPVLVRQAARQRLAATRSVVRRPGPLLFRIESLAVRLDRFVGVAWASASFLLTLAFLRALVRLSRRRGGWREDRLRGGSVLVAPDAGPAVVGVVHPRIVIPEWATTLGATELSLLLRHEREHVEARDPAALLLATLVLIVFPWNVALWWMAHRLRLAIEIDCDARVLRAIDAPRDYGMLLLAVGERRSLALPMSASLAERRSLLERRIQAMTSICPRHPLAASLPFAAVAIAAGLAAAQSPPPSSVVMEKAIVQAKMAAEVNARETLPLTQIYTLIAAHLPAALQSDADGNRVTIVLDANDDFIGAVMQPAPEERATPMLKMLDERRTAAKARGDIADSEKVIVDEAALEKMVAEKMVLAKMRSGNMSAERAGAQAADLAALKRRLGEVSLQASTQLRADTLVIDGLGAMPGEDIRSMEKQHYARGELGPAALNVLIVRLK